MFITGVGTFIAHPWRPHGKVQFGEAREMLSFGFKSTGSQYLQHLYNNISYQIVGYYFGSSALGAYRLAYEIVLYPINYVNNVVTQVAFPAFARVSHSQPRARGQFLQFSRQNLAVAMPILVVLLVAATEFLARRIPASQVTRRSISQSGPSCSPHSKSSSRELGDISTPVRLLCIVGLLAGDRLPVPTAPGCDGLRRPQLRGRWQSPPSC